MIRVGDVVTAKGAPGVWRVGTAVGMSLLLAPLNAQAEIHLWTEVSGQSYLIRGSGQVARLDGSMPNDEP